MLLPTSMEEAEASGDFVGIEKVGQTNCTWRMGLSRGKWLFMGDGSPLIYKP